MHVTGNPWVISGPPAPNPCAWVWLPCVGTHGLHVTNHHTINAASTTITTVPPPSLSLRQNSIYTTNTTTTPTTTQQHHDRTRNNEGGDGLSCPSPIIGVFFKIYYLILLTNSECLQAQRCDEEGFPPPRHVKHHFRCGEEG